MNTFPRLGLAFLLALGMSGPAGAATGFDIPSLAEKTARRFPQPVRVGDLIGRRLLEPHEKQAVLGRVRGVVRRADGGVDLLVGLGGWFGASRIVSVPSEAIALLGEHVVLVGGSPEALRALPEASDKGAIGPGETIRMGLTKPFH